MRNICVTSCLFLTVATAKAQTAQSDRLLPQWLTGIIAVVCFLFLTFVFLLVKKTWCKGTRRRKTETGSEEVRVNVFTNNTFQTRQDLGRSKHVGPAFDNPDYDDSEEKVTSM